MASGVNPVFLKARDVPNFTNDRPVTVLEMCIAAERVTGQGSIVGAQLINGLWRVYPATKQARSVLLVQGLNMRGTSIQVKNINPFILRNESGEEKPSTKVWVDNIPISVADSEIEHALVKNGCELRSQIKKERARDADRNLTRFLTGRRFVFITLPTVPLDKTMQVSVFTAKIFHREQKIVKRAVVCSRCLEQNHHASECKKDIVCRSCRKPGHKKGDPKCDMAVEKEISSESDGMYGKTVESERAERGEKEESEIGGKNGNRGEEREKEKEKTRGKKDSSSQVRGRTSARQSLRTSVTGIRSPRSRSQTPKRRRSGENVGTESSGSKFAKCDIGLSDCPAPLVLDHEDEVASD